MLVTVIIIKIIIMAIIITTVVVFVIITKIIGSFLAQNKNECQWTSLNQSM